MQDLSDKDVTTLCKLGHFGKLIATTLCQYSGKILSQMAAVSIGIKVQ